MTYSHWDGTDGFAVIYTHGHRHLHIERYIIGFLFALAAIIVFSVVNGVFGGVQKLEISLPAPRPVTVSPIIVPPQTEAPVLGYNKEKLASIVNAWAAQNKGTESVVVAELDGNVLAASNPEQTFFTASIYKLYVIYLAYQDIDAGLHSLEDPYLNGWTRGKCLDEAIRSSHSPCAEKLMAELGKTNIQTRLDAFGFKNTRMKGLITSAQDAAIILSRLGQGSDLSASSNQLLLASMLGQQYRNALAKGFDASKVYNKVGFREESEYHDVAIVRLADGRQVIVSVLTSGVGVKSISQLADSLETSMTN